MIIIIFCQIDRKNNFVNTCKIM
jgi:hypothetical protein